MKKECATCGGSGQTSYFKGVSRFLLSREECPECCGTGYYLDDEISDKKKQAGDKNGDHHHQVEDDNQE